MVIENYSQREGGTDANVRNRSEQGAGYAFCLRGANAAVIVTTDGISPKALVSM